jgi:hypothetical protein
MRYNTTSIYVKYFINNGSKIIIFLDSCFGQSCSGHGSCIVDAADTSDGYLCRCIDGYIGNDCEIGKQYSYRNNSIIYLSLSLFVLRGVRFLNLQTRLLLGIKSYTWDFEDGTMQGFEKVSGDCGVQPLKYVGSGDSKWILADGGTYFVNTARYGASVDSTIGTDEKKCVFGDKSHYFKITSEQQNHIKITPHTEITWHEAGKGHSVCLNRLSDDVELLCKRNSHENVDMQKRSFSISELSSLVGETCYFTFADEQTGSWDHIQLDNLKVTYEDEGKYVLFVLYCFFYPDEICQKCYYYFLLICHVILFLISNLDLFLSFQIYAPRTLCSRLERSEH